MNSIKIFSIKDVIFIVKLMLQNFNITIPAQYLPIIENDIKDYALQVYIKKIKEDDSLSTNVMV